MHQNVSKGESERWGIYVHVPWCRRRCPYCDFYFEIGKSKIGFAQRILNEFKLKKDMWPASAPHTLYLGGGTPSLLSFDELSTCIGGLKEATGAMDWEVSLEANPEDLTPALLGHLRAAGVDRLSLGLQSFDDQYLEWLGRAHRSAHAKDVLQATRDEGFEKVSVDLIFGLPHEPLTRVQEELEWLQRFQVTHLSAYLLTVEEKTPLLKQIEAQRKEAPDPDHQALVYETLQKEVAHLGFEQYEISSWAQPGHESQHNRIYWSQGSYMGLGPGAHSCRLLPAGDMERRANRPHLKNWWDGTGDLEEIETLCPQEAFLESVAFGLRDMKKGISLSKLAKRHQVDLPSKTSMGLVKMRDLGWLQLECERWFLTPQGALFADAVAREILS